MEKIVTLSIILFCLLSNNLYAAEKLNIEKEVDSLGSKMYLTVAKFDGHSLSASTKLPRLSGDELMRIKYKPNNGTLHTMYYYRNGVLEGYHEYNWGAPKNSLSFKKSKERRLGFKGSSVIEGVASLSEVETILNQSKNLYSTIKSKQNDQK